MKIRFILLLIVCHTRIVWGQQIGPDARVHLPNGWSLTPVGRSLELGDLPLNLVVSHSKKWIAVTNNGQSTQTVQLIDVVHHRELSKLIIGKSWFGLAFSPDDKFLYASGGNDNQILKYATTQGRLTRVDSISLGPGFPALISPAGITIDKEGKNLYVVTKENNSLCTVHLRTKEVDSVRLGAEAYTCLLSKNEQQLFISVWGGRKILVYSIESKRMIDSITVGDHPNDLCLTKNGRRLFVANANDNSVSVIDVPHRRVMETLDAALFPASPAGSTTNAVALSSDDKTLFIANADNNCLAVFDVSSPGYGKSKGFIPVGWYPTTIKVVGNEIFVANAKGFTSLANPLFNAFDTTAPNVSFEQAPPKTGYIGGLFTGTLSYFQTPTHDELKRDSRLVYENTPYSKKN